MEEREFNAQADQMLAQIEQLLEACEAEKQHVGSELRQLRQASAGARAYQDAE